MTEQLHVGDMFRMKRLGIFLLAVLAFPAFAALLVDNGNPDPQAGAVASNLANHDPEYEFQSADDFTLSSSAMITRIRWWGVYQGPNLPLDPEEFTLRIFADAGGSPASTPLVELPLTHILRKKTDVVTSGYDVYEYTAILAPPLNLDAGTYWISIVANVDSEEVGTDWLWALSSATSGNFQARVNDAAPWEPLHAFALAFEIEGVARTR